MKRYGKRRSINLMVQSTEILPYLFKNGNCIGVLSDEDGTLMASAFFIFRTYRKNRK